jgi:hypothetical protein
MQNKMEQNDLLVEMIGNLREDIGDFKKEIKDDLYNFKNDNCKDHSAIMTRQDTTNGSIGRLKKSQIILRTVLFTIAVVLFVLGFMPSRLYEILMRLF